MFGKLLPQTIDNTGFVAKARSVSKVLKILASCFKSVLHE